MPTYLYRCRKCREEIERPSSVAARDVPWICPACGSNADRVFTPCAIKMPPDCWRTHTARDFLGVKGSDHDDESARERVTVTVGMGKVRPRI